MNTYTRFTGKVKTCNLETKLIDEDVDVSLNIQLFRERLSYKSEKGTRQPRKAVWVVVKNQWTCLICI